MSEQKLHYTFEITLLLTVEEARQMYHMSASERGKYLAEILKRERPEHMSGPVRTD